MLYKDLLAQREKLEKQIEEAKSREYAEVLNDVKQKIADTAPRRTGLSRAKAGWSARRRCREIPRSGNGRDGPRQAAALDRRQEPRTVCDLNVRLNSLQKSRVSVKERGFLFSALAALMVLS